MSDLLELEEKVKKGDDWRGEHDVEYGGETHTVLYRHLYDDEFSEAINIIGDENFEDKIKLLQDVASNVSQSQMEEYQDVMEEMEDNPDDLSDEQRERLEDLQKSVEGAEGYECPSCGADGLFSDLQDPEPAVEYQCPECGVTNQLANYEKGGSDANTFALYDKDLVAGTHFAAEKGIEPDDEDVTEVLNMSPSNQKQRFGRIIQNDEKARTVLQEQVISTIIERSSGWTAYEIGLNILFESLDGEKN